MATNKRLPRKPSAEELEIVRRAQEAAPRLIAAAERVARKTIRKARWERALRHSPIGRHLQDMVAIDPSYLNRVAAGIAIRHNQGEANQTLSLEEYAAEMLAKDPGFLWMIVADIEPIGRDDAYYASLSPFARLFEDALAAASPTGPEFLLEILESIANLEKPEWFDE